MVFSLFLKQYGAGCGEFMVPVIKHQQDLYFRQGPEFHGKIIG